MEKKFKLVYDLEYEKKVNEKVVPLFNEIYLSKIAYKSGKSLNLKNDEIVLLYLNELQLYEFLKISLKEKNIIGILPHDKSGKLLLDFGISSILEEAFEDIINNDKIFEANILFCNNIPVFKSVKIGEMFMYNQAIYDQNIFKKINWFIDKIKVLSKNPHKQYTLSVNDNKIIDTCALGLSIVSSLNNSIVAKRIIGENTNEGIHVIISSPKSILEMLRFSIGNYVLKKEMKLPEFIGYLRGDKIKIKSRDAINFVLDGIDLSAKEIELTIKENELNIITGRNFKNDYNKINSKIVQKIKGLPTGETRDEFILNHIPWFKRASTDEFKDLFEILRENAILSQEFMVMLILATLIATFGLFSNSVPVIIGAMILAPLMGPIISLSMAVVRQDVKLLKVSLKTLAIGTLGALFFGFLLTLIIPLKRITPEIQARLSPNILDLMVAITSGIAGAYVNSKEKIARSLAGVAIAVALVPPLAVAGIGVGWGEWSVFYGAFLLYLTNLAGIILAAGISFLMLGFAPFHRAKKGLFYILFVVFIICIPLSISFKKVSYEAELIKKLENIKIADVLISDARVIPAEKVRISVKLVSSAAIDDEKINEIKEEIRKIVKKPFEVEVSTAIILK